MGRLELSSELKQEFPFEPHYFTQADGSFQHYIDEGQGEVVLMLHGNPTWSFFYRNLIKGLKTTHRVIALDHVGCGLSEKSSDLGYELKDHVNRLCHFVETLDLKNINLVLHDWGGAIGMGLATRYPERIKRTIMMNTAAFRSKEIPWRIGLCKIPVFGEILVRAFNGFAGPATHMAVSKKMPKIVKKGYLFPYNNYQNRLANFKFVQDIPLSPKHPSYQTLSDIEHNLKKVKGPKLILWGEKDFCFTLSFYKRWFDFFPEARGIVYPKANHYLLEDEPVQTLKEIKQFLQESP